MKNNTTKNLLNHADDLHSFKYLKFPHLKLTFSYQVQMQQHDHLNSPRDTQNCNNQESLIYN